MKVKLRELSPEFNYELWHPWFAWCPIVTEDRHWVWLNRVWRKGTEHRYRFGQGVIISWSYEYKLLPPEKPIQGGESE